MKPFPPIDPYHTEMLPVSTRHTLYVEQSGNPDGIPVVFLHGGPGAGSGPCHRQLFDPRQYRIVIFDQRGCGNSTPHASVEENTTWDLVADIEKIRSHFGIDRWLVFGGSWGSTLSLAYAQTHPDRVTGLILRGIFLCQPEEILWFAQEGCHWIFPERWELFARPIPEHERHDILNAYHQRLFSEDSAIAQEAAIHWSGWEGATCKLIPDQAAIDDFEDPHRALAIARIESHYFVNNAFLSEKQLLRDAHKLAGIPTWIIHGRYDVICPAKNAWDLAQVMPHARLQMIPDAGHAYSEPGILHALLSATEEFAASQTCPAT